MKQHIIHSDHYQSNGKQSIGNARLSFADLDGNDTINPNTEILQTQSYYPFGLTHSGLQSPQVGVENLYQFNGTEEIPELGWNHTLFRTYDPSIGRWGQIDPKGTERESHYVGLGNNPIRLSDPIGDTIDVSLMNEAQLTQYQEQLALLKQNDLFATYYSVLENSETTYTVRFGDEPKGEGQYNDETKEVIFKEDSSLSSMTTSQELFHAYQDDTGAYNEQDRSVRETEGDIVSQMIVYDLGEPFTDQMGTESWGSDLLKQFGGLYAPLPGSDSVLSTDTVIWFGNAVDKRIEYFEKRGTESQGYVQPNSGKGPIALFRAYTIMRENKKN